MKSYTRSTKGVALLAILGVLISIYSCYMASAEEPVLTDLTAFTFSGTTVTVKEGTDTNYEVVVLTAADGLESAAAVSTDSSGNTVYSLPSGFAGELQVGIKKAGGSYLFAGNGTGSIVVKKAATDAAHLYLNGLTLTSAITAPIAVNKDSTTTCTVYAVEGTTNTLTDSAYNNGDTNTANLVAENAVIKCKAASNVTLAGSGTLNIVGKAKNGIKANNLLYIDDAIRLNITAEDDGISGEHTVTVNSGYVNITAKEGDGIKCGADDAATGDIIINGGTVTIDSYGDGMQATANLTVNGGVLDITCYDGYTANYNSSSTSHPSAKGLKAGGTYTPAGSTTEVDATECNLTINGGFIKINSADDAIHSDQAVTITAGVLDLYTAGDGVHADYTNTIGVKGADNTDLYLTIHKCYEGIEGANIYIHSGIINIFASDDSINAANSDLGSSAPGASSGYTITVDITGGFVYCASTAGDCLDSNRNFTITGGTLVVLGSITQQDNTAVDTDGSFNIQGGEILTIGNSGMMTNPTTTQNYCSWTSAGTATASTGGTSSGGSTRPTRPGAPGSSGSAGGSGVVSNNQQLTITDASGNVMISVAVQWDGTVSGSAGYVLYSNADLTSGSSYTLSVGTIQSVTGGSNITTPSVPAQPATPETDVTDTPTLPTTSSTPSTDTTSSGTVSSTPSTDNTSSNSSQTTPPAPPASQDGSQPELPAGMTKGDVNQDGFINAGDALLVLLFAVEKQTPTTEQTMIGDVDNNRVLNAVDALWILQYAVGTRTEFA